MGFISSFFLAILALSYVELTLLVNVSAKIGFLGTFSICFLTAVIGGSLARKEGFAVLGEMQTKISRGIDPSTTVIGGVLLFVSGVLLLVPGFVTDVFGFLCLWKPLRESVGAYIFKKIRDRASFGSTNTRNRTGFETTFKSYTYYSSNQNSSKTVDGMSNDKARKEVKTSDQVIDVEFSDSKD